jgi:dienelactone hydrolase
MSAGPCRSSHAFRAGIGLFLIMFSMLCPPQLAQAQTEVLNLSLGERIEFVKYDDSDSVGLQVTVFQPDGPGPFPVVVINHGKDLGDPHLQARHRPVAAAREFLERGYAVVAPMRRGFAGSGGTLVEDGCNTEANGQTQTEDFAALVKWLRTQSWADTSRMMMAGQSYGGLTTIAYSQDPDPGFKLFVNFAGGVKYAIGCQWQLRLREAFQSYGKKSRAPSMWFYGENDSYFPPGTIAPAFTAFEAAGGNGEMVAYGPFGGDAHGMFANVDGVDIWLDKVLLRMEKYGLPVEVTLPRYGRVGGPSQSTGYAELADIVALKLVNEGSEKAYSAFLEKRLPRAFVIALKARKQTYAWGGDNPVARALEACHKANGETCVLYAVDDVVAWKKDELLTTACCRSGGDGDPQSP